MKMIRRECRRGYQHYFVRTESDLTEVDPQVWDRTVTLECFRCQMVMWIDTTIRAYFGVKNDGDWGT